MKAQYPLTVTAAAKPAVIVNGDFVPGQLYRCVSVNPKAKKGENGQPRFTEGAVYMCIANATSITETRDIPPTYLVDNNFRAVNCGKDAKLKTAFIDADAAY